MADLKTVTDALVVAFDALSGVDGRLAITNYRTDLVAITPGQTRYQLRGQYEVDEGVNSASPKKAVSFVVEFHHHIDLVAGDSEEDHLDVDMVTIQSALTGSAFWKAIAGVFRVRDGPDLEVNVSREGNVISYGVGVGLVLDL